MMEKRIVSFGFKKICIGLFTTYLIFALSFYFLCGYQLHFRQSKGNLSMPSAESGTVELTEGASVTQDFIVSIHRLQNVSVQWGTYHRPNSGSVLMQLYNLQDNSLLMSQSFDVATISEGSITSMAAEKPIETIYGVPLRLIITSNSLPGSAASPMMSATAQGGNSFILALNNEPVEGILCFVATGEDYIWTGLHYWKLVSAMGVVFALYLYSVYRKWTYGKNSLLVNAVFAMSKYRFLIKQLVARDFKSKYKRSVLGVFWSFLNPLLTMIVQYMVFSNLFRFDVPYYPVYLLCGIILFNFFSEACGMTLASIVGNASLITKVYVPKYVYPMTRVLSSFINFLIALVPLFAVALFSGLHPTKAWLLLPFVLICLAVFSLGLGMLLATAMTFFRDTQFLWGVLSMIWMYLTPIFYPASILPENIVWVLKCNPLYYFVTFIRVLIIDGVSPEPVIYFICASFSLCMLGLGAALFKKHQDNFVLYL